MLDVKFDKLQFERGHTCISGFSVQAFKALQVCKVFFNQSLNVWLLRFDWAERVMLPGPLGLTFDAFSATLYRL